MALGFFTAAGITLVRGRKLGLGFDAVFTLTLVACIASLVGARAWYVATHLSAYHRWFELFLSGGMDLQAGGIAAGIAAVLLALYARPLFRPLGPGAGTLALLCASAVTGLLAARIASLHHLVPIDPFAPGDGGLAFFGGLALAVPACMLAAVRLRIPIPAGADACAPGILAGAAVGRVGCFLNGCCFGRPAHGILAPGGRIPTQLIEAGFTATVAAILVLLFPEPRNGRTAAVAILAYCTARFSLEFLRDDTTSAFPGFTANQAAALAIALPAVWLALRRSSQGTAAA
ncbi:MAG: prolipoprotein diacylglyceryl transferase [Planctomycetes bacterium]|nr:prolipoprotein diacylglyceryl transferase [Planctomycetota bacterium]